MRTNYAIGSEDPITNVNPFMPKPTGPVLPEEDKPFKPKPKKCLRTNYAMVVMTMMTNHCQKIQQNQ